MSIIIPCDAEPGRAGRFKALSREQKIASINYPWLLVPSSVVLADQRIIRRLKKENKAQKIEIESLRAQLNNPFRSTGIAAAAVVSSMRNSIDWTLRKLGGLVRLSLYHGWNYIRILTYSARKVGRMVGRMLGPLSLSLAFNLWIVSLFVIIRNVDRLIEDV